MTTIPTTDDFMQAYLSRTNGKYDERVPLGFLLPAFDSLEDMERTLLDWTRNPNWHPTYRLQLEPEHPAFVPNLPCNGLAVHHGSNPRHYVRVMTR